MRPSLALVAPLLLSLACVTPPRREGAAAEAGTAGPRAALAAFADAVADGRWDVAYPLLSARWRASATPSRLASDFTASGPVGSDAVARVRALLAGGAVVRTEGPEATLAIGGQRAARLLLEGGAWRVDALE